MSELGHAESFRDWLVYKKARMVAKEIFELTKGSPKKDLKTVDKLNENLSVIGRMLSSMIEKADQFCKTKY